MFRKILIANRGEIACRIIRTARRMGILTVAVHSDADREALHVQMADEAVAIGPAPSRDSYLVAQRILAACRSTGAQAVHPGYGFLSENEAFARAAEDQGITFIGPGHQAIAAMGDKIASKKLAQAAGVNTIPGWTEAIASADEAAEIARRIGYPVMVKASAGGGGKGLRVVLADSDMADAFQSCRNEARNSFGDDRVFIEKYVEEPRHIEIQVLGDSHGNLVYLHERECSIQRRHQKLVEEAPSPFISEATRVAMGGQAVALARAVRYRSAGTVEFVVDRGQRFYFLEMNTRLQVEHPVTECITGLDLVEWMIRIAAGEPLGFTQQQVARRGWAIECRVNAEDPARGFLPSTGRLVRYRPPAATLQAGGAAAESGVRVDDGVVEGGEIPMHYDALIAKVIAYGRDRADALQRMRDALNGFVVQGISSNVAFHAALLAHPEFRSGHFDTGFIARHYPGGVSADQLAPADPGLPVALAAAVDLRLQGRAGAGRRGASAASAARRVAVVRGHAGESHEDVTIEDPVGPVLTVRGRRHELAPGWSYDGICMSGSCNGVPFTAQVECRGVWLRVVHDGAACQVLMTSSRGAELMHLMPRKAPPDTSKLLLSPMPGLLVDVHVTPGQPVRAGERLAVIEAMKMENILTAAHEGTVAEVLARRGETVAVDQPIVRFA